MVFGTPTTPMPSSVSRLATPERVLAADRDERVDAEPVRLVADRVDPAVELVGVGPGRAEDGAAAGRMSATSSRPSGRVSPSSGPFQPSRKPDELVPVGVDPLGDDGPDDCIEAGAVAATGQHSDSHGVTSGERPYGAVDPGGPSARSGAMTFSIVGPAVTPRRGRGQQVPRRRVRRARGPAGGRARWRPRPARTWPTGPTGWTCWPPARTAADALATVTGRRRGAPHRQVGVVDPDGRRPTPARSAHAWAGGRMRAPRRLRHPGQHPDRPEVVDAMERRLARHARRACSVAARLLARAARPATRPAATAAGGSPPRSTSSPPAPATAAQRRAGRPARRRPPGPGDRAGAAAGPQRPVLRAAVQRDAAGGAARRRGAQAAVLAGARPGRRDGGARRLGRGGQLRDAPVPRRHRRPRAAGPARGHLLHHPAAAAARSRGPPARLRRRQAGGEVSRPLAIANRTSSTRLCSCSLPQRVLDVVLDGAVRDEQVARRSACRTSPWRRAAAPRSRARSARGSAPATVGAGSVAIRRNSPSTSPARPGVNTGLAARVSRTASSELSRDADFTQVAGRTGLDRLEHVLLLPTRREHQHAGGQAGGHDRRAHLVAAQPGQVEVQHQHAGRVARVRRTAAGPSLGRGHDREPGSVRSRATASRHIGWSSATTTVTACGSAARPAEPPRRPPRERPGRPGPPVITSSPSSGASAPPSCPRPRASRSTGRAPRGPSIRPADAWPRPSCPVAAASANRPGATPTPSSRTVTTTCSPSSSSSTQAEAPSPACRRRCPAPARTAAAELARRPGARAHGVGRGRRRAPCPRRSGRRRPAHVDHPLDGGSGVGEGRPLTSARSSRSWSAAMAPRARGLAAQLGAAPVDVGQGLQHAVVHGPGQPVPLAHLRPDLASASLQRRVALAGQVGSSSRRSRRAGAAGRCC